MSSDRKLFVISAPSGAGKSTLCQRLLAARPDLSLSISTTTRAPRGTEQHGKEYFFVTREKFEAMIAAGEFAEWAQVHGNYYGTSKSAIQDAFNAGKHVLLDIDVQGAASLAQVYGKTCVRIFVRPPDLAELERRLRTRGTDSEETIQKRLKGARAEMDREHEFDRVIVNDDLDRSFRELLDKVNLAADVQAAGKG